MVNREGGDPYFRWARLHNGDGRPEFVGVLEAMADLATKASVR